MDGLDSNTIGRKMLDWKNVIFLKKKKEEEEEKKKKIKVHVSST